MRRKPPHVEPEPTPEPVDLSAPTTFFEDRHPATLPAHNAAMSRRRRTNGRILRVFLILSSALIMLIILVGLFTATATPPVPAIQVTPPTAAAVPVPTIAPPVVPPVAGTGQASPTVLAYPAGTYEVGKAPGQITPGKYRTDGPSPDGYCYWARLRDTDGSTGSIITNAMVKGPTVVTIKATDAAFEIKGDCMFVKV